MRALDTNVVLRLIVGDDPTQQAIAREVVQRPCIITSTVLIETGWVLGSNYGFDRTTIVSFIETLLDHPVIHIAAAERVRWALRRYVQQGDFADLIHIAACGEVAAFVTFDQGVAKAASIDSPISVETLA